MWPRSINLLLIVLAFAASCTPSPKTETIRQEEDTFERAVAKILVALKEKNAAGLNRFIHPDTDLTIIYRDGVFNQYAKVERVQYDELMPNPFLFTISDTNGKIRYEKLPTFDCDGMKWTKYGLYCDTLENDHLLSSTAANLVKYRGDHIAQEEIEAYTALEDRSRRIVLADPTEGDLVFYLSYIEGKWYLTILDKVTSSCSA
jgi:hypothetical protein